MKSKCLIIGYGVVGRNLHKELDGLDVDVVDKYKKEVTTKDESIKYDFGFVCVDTPLLNGQVDISSVKDALNENDCKIYVIKSTCPVGTVDLLIKETGKRIVFSPEYYGGTLHCNNFDFDFTILGGNHDDCIAVQQILQNCYDARHRFAIVDSKTAEMVKFMENAWLATKVTFCCDFYQACKQANICYEDVRELFILDPRVNPSHTFVYSNTPFWDSHCLNKDVPSIANQFNMPFLKNVIKINGDYKELK